MKKYCMFILLIAAQVSFSQRVRTIAGTYMNIMGHVYKNADGCCKLIEVLKLKPNNSFSFYQKDDQGDYDTEAFSVGRYTVKGDSVFFLSELPFQNEMVKQQPVLENIDSDMVRIVFDKNCFNNARQLFANEYYTVDDSLNQKKLKVFKTVPSIKDLLDTIDSRIEINYKKEEQIKQVEVFIQKPKEKFLLIKVNEYLHTYSLVVANPFALTNNVLFDRIQINKGFVFDYSGYKFKIVKYGLQKSPYPPGGGEPTPLLYRKNNFGLLDSFKINCYHFDTTGSTNESITVAGNRIKYDYSKDSYRKRPSSKSHKDIIISNAMKEKLSEQIAEQDLFELSPSSNFSIYDSSAEITFYFKHEQFKWHTRIFSPALHSFLFKELISAD